MEATRLREWEKSRQAELEAHRQVRAKKLTIICLNSVAEGDRESNCSAGKEGNTGSRCGGDQDQGGRPDQGHRRHEVWGHRC